MSEPSFAIGQATPDSAVARIVRGTPWLLDALHVVRAVGPAGAYIAAGAVRDTVWNCLTGRASSGPHADVDVVYWADLEGAGGSQSHEQCLRRMKPEFDWEVTNQATVHLWRGQIEGSPVAPYKSVADGMASWPETATAIGVRLTDGDDIDVLAPLGLADLFDLRLRYNPAGPGPAVFWRRIATKSWTQRWPELHVVTPQS
jgi:hypothetical protein